MRLSLEAQKRILEVGGEAMLRRALAANGEAARETKNLEGVGVAWKATNGETVERLSEVLQLGSDLRLERQNVVNLVKDMGIDRAERALLILAGESPETTTAARLSLVEKMVGARVVQSTAKWNGKTLIGGLYGGQ